MPSNSSLTIFMEVIPTTLPDISISGPPLLPGLIEQSVWISVIVLMTLPELFVTSISRAIPLMIPQVMVPERLWE